MEVNQNKGHLKEVLEKEEASENEETVKTILEQGLGEESITAIEESKTEGKSEKGGTGESFDCSPGRLSPEDEVAQKAPVL